MTTPSAKWSVIVNTLELNHPVLSPRNVLSIQFLFRSKHGRGWDSPVFSQASEIPNEFSYFFPFNQPRDLVAYVEVKYRAFNPLNVRTVLYRTDWKPAYYPLKGPKLKVTFWWFREAIKISSLNMLLTRKASTRVSAGFLRHMRLSLRKQSQYRNAIRNQGRSSGLPNPYVRSRTAETEYFQRTGNTVQYDNFSTDTRPIYKKIVRTRNVTPGFFSRDSRRPLPDLAYDVTYLDVDDSMAFQTLTTEYTGPPVYTDAQEWYGPTRWFYDPSWATLDDSEVGGAQNKAIAKLNAKMGQDVNNIMQDIAQWWQLEHLALGNLRAIISALQALRRGNLSGAVTALWKHKSGGRYYRREAGHLYPVFRKGGGLSVAKSLAQNWLELQYGWKPLLLDIHGLIKSIQQLNATGDFPVLEARAGGSASNRSVWPINASPFKRTVNGFSNTQMGYLAITRKTSYHYGVKYTIDDQTRAFLAQTGFLNPIDLGWEVLPFSFVLDWFIPVGQFLEGLSACQGLTFLSGYESIKTVKHKYTLLDVKKTVVNGIYSKTTLSCRGLSHERHVSFTRNVLSDWPHMGVPSPKNGLSTLHIANALALLASLLIA